MNTAKLNGQDVSQVPLELEPMQIGDVNYNYPTPQPPAAPKRPGTLAKVGMAAALLAAGGGLGMAAPLVLDQIRGPDPPTQPIVQPDSDTQYGLDITVGDQ